ncbi:bifunctional serine/threonine-protein kinase/ABC transporter substrate-binding protein [Streptomyces sp. O3]
MRGSLLDGRYRLEESVGAGGMGEVWRARDEELGRRVAVKVFSPPGDIEETERAELLARFRREARAAAALSSPHIVTVFDHGTGRAEGGDRTGERTGHDGGPGDDTGDAIPYLVMELLTGRAFHEVLRDEGRVALDTALDWTGQICKALEVAHGAGVVHRDIKPANLMAGADGTVQVMDFGIATFLEGAESASRLTRTGMMPIGSVLYMAPEQFRMERGDGRIDLYALGCVLYELLVGRPPFVGPAAGVMYNHLNDTPLRPSRARTELGPDVDRLVLDLMAKDPEDRPQNAGAALERVREIREVREAYAEPEPESEPESGPEPKPEPESESEPEPASPPPPVRPRYVRIAPVPGAPPKPAPKPVPRAGERYVRTDPIPATPTLASVRAPVPSPDAPSEARRTAVSIALALALLGGGAFVVKNVEHHSRASSPGGTSSSATVDDAADPYVIAVLTRGRPDAPTGDPLANRLKEALDKALSPTTDPEHLPQVVTEKPSKYGSSDTLKALRHKHPRLLAVIGQTNGFDIGTGALVPIISTCYGGVGAPRPQADRHLAIQPDPADQAAQLSRYLDTRVDADKLLILPSTSTSAAVAEALHDAFAAKPANTVSFENTTDAQNSMDTRRLLARTRPDSIVILGSGAQRNSDSARNLRKAGFDGEILISNGDNGSHCTVDDDEPDPLTPPGTLRFRPVSRQVSPADCTNQSPDFCREVGALPERRGALEELQATRLLAAALKSMPRRSTSSVTRARTELWRALSSAQVDGLTGTYSPSGGHSADVQPLWLDRLDEDGMWQQLGPLPDAGQR